jgi:hypothetical protein
LFSITPPARTCLRVPIATIRPRPPQHLQVAIRSHERTRLPTPLAPVRLGPSQQLDGHDDVLEHERHRPPLQGLTLVHFSAQP